LIHFARALRTAGIAVGPGRVLDALDAVQIVGLKRRDDYYWTLHALFVTHPRQRELFDQAFHIFWRNPQLLERTMSLVMPSEAAADDERSDELLNKRLSEAFFPQGGAADTDVMERPSQAILANLSWSATERLMSMDFESMSNAEMSEAKRIILRMRLATRQLQTRRYRTNKRGALVDLRATLRASVRRPHAAELMRREKRRRPPAIVVLCDISGSMSRYSRMVLHFLHALSSARDKVHSFVFGTRLTNITRYLRAKDVDIALGQVATAVDDWRGGTRIGHCLAEFNRLWSRRTLAQGAVVLLISDGLDRDAGDGLAAQMQRLNRSCRRLVWLNPLLRFEQFEPRTMGAKAMLPYVDDFRSIHNLRSMVELASALEAPAQDHLQAMQRWRTMARQC
jgi:uncharacterized protein with von Willebrand factor type A (vWA) domain